MEERFREGNNVSGLCLCEPDLDELLVSIVHLRPGPYPPPESNKHRVIWLLHHLLGEEQKSEARKYHTDTACIFF